MHSTHCFIQSHQKLAWLVTSCPLTDSSSTEFSTIYTVLKDAQATSNTMGQEDTLSNSIWSCYMCEGQANTVQACKQVFRCCVSNGYVSYRIDLLGGYWQKVPKLGLEDLLIENRTHSPLPACINLEWRHPPTHQVTGVVCQTRSLYYQIAANIEITIESRANFFICSFFFVDSEWLECHTVVLAGSGSWLGYCGLISFSCASEGNPEVFLCVILLQCRAF